MAYHFQPQADSSDDEQVDITSWQTAARPKSASAPVATMNGATHSQPKARPRSTMSHSNGSASEGDVDEEQGDGAVLGSDMPHSSNVQQAEPTTSKSESSEASLTAPSFTFLNQTVSSSSSSNEKDLLQSELRPEAQKSRVLAPIIPRIRPEDMDDDVLDFTTGGDVVRSVIEEMAGKHGDTWYRVEYADFRVHEVSLAVLSQSLHRVLHARHDVEACSPSSILQCKRTHFEE